MTTETRFNDDLYNAVQAGEISETSEIDVDIFNGPMGGYGFRSGNWDVTINGIKFWMFHTLSHHLDLNEQSERLLHTVRKRIARAVEGETFLNEYTGEVDLKYSSQMKRQHG